MNDVKLTIELDADQHYKLLQVLINYLDALSINTSWDTEAEEIRQILSESWAKRFDFDVWI